MQKTYKREVAGVMLAVLWFFCVLAVWYPQALDVVRILSVPTFLAAGGAFGLDALAKQLKDPMQ